MKWEQGRQNTGYKKFKIFSGIFSLPCDLYLLYYPKDSFIPSFGFILDGV